MKHKLLLRLIIGYILFGVFSFITVAVFTSNYNKNYLREQTASFLYKEAGQIASSYASEDFSTQFTWNEFQKQLSSLSAFLASDIYIINNDGEILISSLGPASLTYPRQIPDFDILDFSSGYYTIGDFYGQYEQDVLTVYAPVTRNYRANCYVLLCMEKEQIAKMQSGLLDGGYPVSYTHLDVYKRQILIAAAGNQQITLQLKTQFSV